MTPVFLGAAAFFVMAVYDIDRAFWKKNLWFSFPAGVLMLAAATVWLIAENPPAEVGAWRGLFGGLAAESFLLLLYTQMGVVKKEPEGTETKLYETGLYAACRHPGLWPFALVYLFLWLYSGSGTVLTAAVIFSVCDLIYIILQDMWLFPRYIEGYNDYKTRAPFLVPTAGSIKRALKKL